MYVKGPPRAPHRMHHDPARAMKSRAPVTCPRSIFSPPTLLVPLKHDISLSFPLIAHLTAECRQTFLTFLKILMILTAHFIDHLHPLISTNRILWMKRIMSLTTKPKSDGDDGSGTREIRLRAETGCWWAKKAVVDARDGITVSLLDCSSCIE